MSDRFGYTFLPLGGLVRIERRPISDHRGLLERLFCAESFEKAGLTKPIVQINRSLTRRRGAVRGMHFQAPPHAETKIVACLSGEVYDVAVDLRSDSATFLRWHGEVLSAENARSVLIPEGFAHGFQALAPDCELLYLHSAPYTASAEGGLHPQDPSIAVTWPLPVAELSRRDAGQPFIDGGYTGVSL